MSDEKVSIDVINDLMETIIQACLVLHDQIGHDFGSEGNVSDGTKFRLKFERIGGDPNWS